MSTQNSDTAWMRDAACVRSPGLPWTTDTDALTRLKDAVALIERRVATRERA